MRHFPLACAAVLSGLALAAGALDCAAMPPTPPPPPLVQKVRPETLRFATPLLKRRFEAALAVASDPQGGGQLEPLTLKEQSWQRGTFFYTARRQIDLPPAPDRRSNVVPAMQPTRQLSVTLWPAQGDRGLVRSLAVVAKYVPPGNGWAASLDYRLTAEGQGHQESLRVYFDHDRRHGGELPASPWDFVVPRNDVTARYRAKGSQLEFIVQPQVEAVPLNRRLARAVATPEALREFGLKLCTVLEAGLRTKVAASDVDFIDWTGVRSDNPPRRFPWDAKSQGPMTAEAQAALLQEGLAQLEERRQRWRDHADELQAAVREASPLIVQWAAEGPEDE